MIPPDAGSENGADWQPSAAPLDGSRRLWSLWDMMRFRTDLFLDLAKSLGEAFQEAKESPPDRALEQQVKKIKRSKN
jgi:hypothetical protein